MFRFVHWDPRRVHLLMCLRNRAKCRPETLHCRTTLIPLPRVKFDKLSLMYEHIRFAHRGSRHTTRRRRIA